MSRTTRATAYAKCYEANCTWCVTGLAKRWAKRADRKRARQEVRRTLRDDT